MQQKAKKEKLKRLARATSKFPKSLFEFEKAGVQLSKNPSFECMDELGKLMS